MVSEISACDLSLTYSGPMQYCNHVVSLCRAKPLIPWLEYGSKEEEERNENSLDGQKTLYLAPRVSLVF